MSNKLCMKHFLLSVMILLNGCAMLPLCEGTDEEIAECVENLNTLTRERSIDRHIN